VPKGRTGGHLIANRVKVNYAFGISVPDREFYILRSQNGNLSIYILGTGSFLPSSFIQHCPLRVVLPSFRLNCHVSFRHWHKTGCRKSTQSTGNSIVDREYGTMVDKSISGVLQGIGGPWVKFNDG
jgi:hypothetical protein